MNVNLQNVLTSKYYSIFSCPSIVGVSLITILTLTGVTTCHVTGRYSRAWLLALWLFEWRSMMKRDFSARQSVVISWLQMYVSWGDRISTGFTENVPAWVGGERRVQAIAHSYCTQMERRVKPVPDHMINLIIRNVLVWRLLSVAR